MKTRKILQKAIALILTTTLLGGSNLQVIGQNEINTENSTVNSVGTEAVEKKAEQSQDMPYGDLMPSTGDVKVLVFMVEFPDVERTNDVTAESRKEELFNLEDVNSFSGFYNTSSYGKLRLDGDVYGYYTAANDSEYYAEKGVGLGNQEIIREVMEYYDDEIDYSDYDADGDGLIDAIYIEYVHEVGEWSGFWWSYQSKWGIYNEEDKITYDGVKANGYVWINESQPELVDVYKHETGHLLGLADYYDATNGDSDGALLTFDMMSANQGDHNAFSKILLGWIDPIVVSEDTSLQLHSSQMYPEAAIVYPNNNETSDEYFVVEYVTAEGANSVDWRLGEYIGDGGIRVWRVNAKLNEAGTNYAYINRREGIKLIEAVGISNFSLATDDWGNTRDTGEVYSKANLYYEGDELTPYSTPSSYIYGDCEEFYGQVQPSGVVIDDIIIDGDIAKLNVEYDYGTKEDFNYKIEYSFGGSLLIELTFDYETALLDADKITLSNGEKEIELVSELKYTSDYGFKKMYILSKEEKCTENGEFTLTIEEGALVNVFGVYNEEINETIEATYMDRTLIKEYETITEYGMNSVYTDMVNIGDDAYMFHKEDGMLWLTRFCEDENGNVVTKEKELVECAGIDVTSAYVAGKKLILAQYQPPEYSTEENKMLSHGILKLYQVTTEGEYKLLYENNELIYSTMPTINVIGEKVLVKISENEEAYLISTDSGKIVTTYMKDELVYDVSAIWSFNNDVYIAEILGKVYVVDEELNVVQELDGDTLAIGNNENIVDYFQYGDNIGAISYVPDGTDEDIIISEYDSEFNLVSRKILLNDSIFGLSEYDTKMGTVQCIEDGYIINLETCTGYMLRYYTKFDAYCSNTGDVMDDSYTSVMECVLVLDKDMNIVSSISGWWGERFINVGSQIVSTTSVGQTYYSMDEIDMTYSDKDIEYIELNKDSIKLGEGSMYRLEEKYEPYNTLTEVIWTSEDEDVAVVDKNGFVTAVGVGTTTIKVTVKGTNELVAECVVEVVEKSTVTDEPEEDEVVESPWSDIYKVEDGKENALNFSMHILGGDDYWSCAMFAYIGNCSSEYMDEIYASVGMLNPSDGESFVDVVWNTETSYMWVTESNYVEIMQDANIDAYVEKNGSQLTIRYDIVGANGETMNLVTTGTLTVESDLYVCFYSDAEVTITYLGTTAELHNKEINDEDTDVSVEFTDEEIDTEVSLVVDALEDGEEAYENLKLEELLVDTSVEDAKFRVYDISLEDTDGNEVQPDGEITVKLPCPEGYDYTKCKVYYIDDKGNVTDMEATYVDGYFVFTTDHFSVYLISENELTSKYDFIYGDANGDGKITVIDAILIKRYIAGYENLNINFEASNVNGDAKVNVVDAIMIMRHLAGYDVVLGQ